MNKELKEYIKKIKDNSDYLYSNIIDTKKTIYNFFILICSGILIFILKMKTHNCIIKFISVIDVSVILFTIYDMYSYSKYMQSMYDLYSEYFRELNNFRYSDDERNEKYKNFKNQIKSLNDKYIDLTSIIYILFSLNAIFILYLILTMK